MKKQISLALAAALLLTLTACGGQSGGGAGTATAGKSADGGAQDAAPAEPVELPDPASVTMEEQVLVDEAGVKVTATALSYSPQVGYPDDDTHNTYRLAFTLENNTDQTLTPNTSMYGVYNGNIASFSVFSAAEAGSTYADTMGQRDVEPGESRDLVLFYNDLNPDAPVQWGICFDFDIGETVVSDDGEILSSATTYLLTDLIPIKTSATDAAPVPRLDPVELFGAPLYEDDAIAVYARSVNRYITTFPGGMVIDHYGVSFCCQNKTDQWLYVQWDDQFVNDLSLDDGSEASAALVAAPQSFGFPTGIGFDREVLDNAGIDTLESFAAHLTAYTAASLQGEGLRIGAYLYTLPDDAQAVSECDISLDKAWIDANYYESESNLGS